MSFSYPFQKDQQPQIPDWEEYIAILARDILKEQSPQMYVLTQLIAVH